MSMYLCFEEKIDKQRLYNYNDGKNKLFMCKKQHRNEDFL